MLRAAAAWDRFGGHRQPFEIQQLRHLQTLQRWFSETSILE
jgi:hypothetical protein